MIFCSAVGRTDSAGKINKKTILKKSRLRGKVLPKGISLTDNKCIMIYCIFFMAMSGNVALS
jgi:hypothetical protein